MNTPPLGWIPPKDRTKSHWDAHGKAVNRMCQTFQFDRNAPDPGPYVNLTELWKHPTVTAKLGFEFPGIHQLTGSCVGAGGGNVLFTLACMEVLRLNDPEEIILPFWLHTYGKSRELLGEKTEGEGSLGSTFARAAREYGCYGNHETGLPQPTQSDGLIWGKDVEMTWSNGLRIGTNWVELGRRHLVGTSTQLKQSEQCRIRLRGYYPLTFACNNYCNPDTCRLAGTGDNKVLLGKLDQYGPHQTSLQAIWDHPELGPIVWNQNQWGKMYALDPKTGRKDGCWMPIAECDRAVRSLDAEIFDFSGYDGYPAQTLDWGSILKFD